ncbi:MAG: ATP-binding protein, partial [Myxococcota bacterium]
EQGRGRVYPSLTPRTVASIANSAQKRALLDQLCPRSLWLMPLRGRSETIGVVALFREQPGAYAAGLQEFGAELGRAAGLAIDLVRSLEGKRRAIEARDYVLGVVAHDLRNPISTIALATKALRLELNEHAALVESKLSLVEKTALQMKILVGDLLQVARLESGLLQVSPVYLDACALVEEVAGSALPLAAAAALQLIVEKPAKPLWVFADPQRLSQALSNLLSNAVKFTPRGGWVRLQLTEFGSKAKFLVEDSGPGIPPAEQQHLFAPFWQSNGGAMEGAGLGLFIASGLVAAHGGKLRVDSALGHGSRFWFQLPRCEEAGSVATSSRPAEFPLPSCGALLVETRAETPSRH